MKRTLIYVLLTAAVIGCAARPLSRAMRDVGAITDAAKTIKDEGKAARPHADNVGKGHIDTVVRKAEDITVYAARLTGELSQAQDQSDALQKKYDKEHNSLWAKIGRFISDSFWLIVSVFGFAVVLRIFSQFNKGVAGTLAAAVSTFIFGLFSAGISWLQALFDNIHFRRKLSTQNVSSS